MSPPAERSILIAEDQILIAEMLAEFAEDLGLRVCGMAVSADQAVEMANSDRPSLVLMDVRLKGNTDGIAAGMAIHSNLGCPIVYVTGAGEAETIARIRQAPGSELLFKPVSLRELEDVILRLMSA